MTLDAHPSGLARRLAEHRRLVVLRCLAEVPAEERQRLLLLCLLAGIPGGAANVSLLRDLAGDAGLPMVRDIIEAHGAWLAGHGLVLAGRDSDVVTLAITPRGGEVAAGDRAWPGVAAIATTDWLHRRMAALAVSASAADVVADVAWLAEAGLVAAGELTGPMLAVTPRGVDVAAGRIVVEGVRKPAFGAALKLAGANAAAMLRD